MSYLAFGIFIFEKNQKTWFSIFIIFSNSKNNNFSFIPFPSKSSIYESQIDRGINYCCIKVTKINNLTKEIQKIYCFLSLNSGKQFAI